MKKLETSKLLLFIVLIYGALFLTAVLIGWMIFDRTDAAGLAGVICGPVSAVIGFYLWKAKNENIKKYGYKPLNESEEIEG